MNEGGLLIDWLSSPRGGWRWSGSWGSDHQSGEKDAGRSADCDEGGEEQGIDRRGDDNADREGGGERDRRYEVRSLRAVGVVDERVVLDGHEVRPGAIEVATDVVWDMCLSDEVGVREVECAD